MKFFSNFTRRRQRVHFLRSQYTIREIENLFRLPVFMNMAEITLDH